MASEVLVVGAGYAGLAVAAILAHNGLEVEVFESTGHLGGRATYDRKDGFLVDYGIHANRFGKQGAAAKALKEAGHEIEFLPMGEPEIYMEGRFVPLPTGVPGFLKAEFLPSADKVRMVLSLASLIMGRKSRKAEVPLREAAWFSDRDSISSMLKLLSGIGLVSPDIEKTSSKEFVYFLTKAAVAKQSVAYPRGGTSQIIEALEGKIERNSKIHLNTRVSGLRFKNGRLVGISSRDKSFDGKCVVIAFPLQKLEELENLGLPSEFVQKCASIIPTAGISIDFCLKEKISSQNGIIVTPEPVTMGQFTSSIDPETAPRGKQLATWYYPLPLELMNDREAVKREEERLLSMLETMFPKMTEKTEWQRTLRLKMVDGFEPRTTQTVKDRPPSRAVGVENLFFAGDTVAAPGSGGDVAFNSAVKAAHEVMNYLR